MDNARRVSAKENVDALKVWAGSRRNGLAAWAARRPVRHFLRQRNVLTLLGFAGVVLSVAALMVVIGIGKTQIVASEFPGQHRADLLANGWFLIGLGSIAFGTVLAGIAISANSSQASARREFPNVAIRVHRQGWRDLPLPGTTIGGPAGPEPSHILLAQYGFTVHSYERDRLANLSFTLRRPLRPGTPGSMDEWVFRPLEKDLPDPAPSFELLPLPLHVEPGRTYVGDVVFDLSGVMGQHIDPSYHGEILIFEHGSGMTVTVPAEIGARHGVGD
jgi:hypothetical protein